METTFCSAANRSQYGSDRCGFRLIFALVRMKFVIAEASRDFRPQIEHFLARLAFDELSLRTRQLAAQHTISISRVVVRNQRSRWGSCSARGTISLNWRLIQTPPFVQDYIIIHELMHIREMNHSPRFWRMSPPVFPNTCWPRNGCERTHRFCAEFTRAKNAPVTIQSARICGFPLKAVSGAFLITGV